MIIFLNVATLSGFSLIPNLGMSKLAGVRR